MLAGHDTTATALTYALWALGHHRDIQDRVAAEAAAIGDRELTPADVPRLEYTVQVLHEALRLCPPAAGVARLATRDIAVAGYRVEAGSLIAIGLYALHRDPTLWDRPLEFDPDRFSPQNSAARDRWQFLPFLGGGRPCIGEHFARLETTLALATIVRAMNDPVAWTRSSPATCRSRRSPAARSGHTCSPGHRAADVSRAATAPPTRTATDRTAVASGRSPTVPPRPWTSPEDR